MEPVVITGGEVDDTEEKGIPGFDTVSRGASPTIYR